MTSVFFFVMLCMYSVHVISCHRWRIFKLKHMNLEIGTPSNSLIRLLHPRSYHELAELYHTVGMFCEQPGEALHPLCNKLDRQYVYLSSDVKRMQAMLNRCVRLHDPRVLQHVPTRKFGNFVAASWLQLVLGFPQAASPLSINRLLWG